MGGSSSSMPGVLMKGDRGHRRSQRETLSQVRSLTGASLSHEGSRLQPPPATRREDAKPVHALILSFQVRSREARRFHCFDPATSQWPCSLLHTRVPPTGGLLRAAFSGRRLLFFLSPTSQLEGQETSLLTPWILESLSSEPGCVSRRRQQLPRGLNRTPWQAGITYTRKYKERSVVLETRHRKRSWGHEEWAAWREVHVRSRCQPSLGCKASSPLPRARDQGSASPILRDTRSTTTARCHCPPARKPGLRRIARVGEAVGRREPRTLSERMRNGAAAVGNSLGVPQKMKIELPYDPSILLLRIDPKELKSGSQGDTYGSLFTVTLLPAAEMWKPKCPSINKWRKGGWCMCTVEYVKKKSCHLWERGWTSKVLC